MTYDFEEQVVTDARLLQKLFEESYLKVSGLIWLIFS